MLPWVYLKLKDGTSPTLDELDLSKINRQKLLDYAQRFLSTVYHLLLEAIASGGATSFEVRPTISTSASPTR
jgi:hypothetical protein